VASYKPIEQNERRELRRAWEYDAETGKVKGKFFLFLIKQNTMKTYGGMEA
jgi:hypothetical protein